MIDAYFSTGEQWALLYFVLGCLMFFALKLMLVLRHGRVDDHQWPRIILWSIFWPIAIIVLLVGATYGDDD